MSYRPRSRLCLRRMRAGVSGTTTYTVGRTYADCRAVVRRRTDEKVSRVGTLETGMSEMKEDVSKMKTVTDDVELWKQMGYGGIVLGVTIADTIGRIGLVVKGKLGRKRRNSFQ